MSYKYEFRTADGRVCCATDHPAHLCPRCAARARGQTVPPPPSLIALIQQRRAPTPRFSVAEYRGDRVERVPAPPSLVRLIQEEAAR